jgi:hypothetical protein
MTWILSATGREVDVCHPRTEHVHIADIAHSLAQINRFTGHAARPYSVAEHSLLVSQIVGQVLHGNHAAQLAGLMHDAHEAYTGDLHTPGKAEVGQAWRLFEGRWEITTRRALGMEFTFLDHAAIVKQADLIALATERRDLMPRGGSPWEVLAGIQPASWDLTEAWRTTMPWHRWRDAFIDQAERLMTAASKDRSSNH